MSPAQREPGRHLVVVGPTASGKSALAMALAQRRRAAGELVEIVSVDSMAVYRGMDIGTTTPTGADRARVPHHCIDLVDPDEEFSVAEYCDAANAALDDIESRGGCAVIVGGTGLYVQALVDALDLPGRYPSAAAEVELEADTRTLHGRLVALDPVAASRIDPDNRRRIVRALEVTIGSGRRFSSFGPGLDVHPPTPFELVGLELERPVLTERVAERIDEQMAAGFLDEVRALLERPTPLSRTAAQALGYKELAAHLRGESSLDDAIASTTDRTRRFGVRQIRWFRRDPRIRWFDPGAGVGTSTELAEAVESQWLRRRSSGSVENPIEGGPGRPLR